MISDALSEAVDEIDRYLHHDHFDGVYAGDLRRDLKALRDQMDAMRRRLDLPSDPKEGA